MSMRTITMNRQSRPGPRTIGSRAFPALMSICLLLPAGASRAGDQVPFKATFHGFATSVTPTADPDVFVIVVPLAGQATHLGRFDERLTHSLNLATGSFVGFTRFTAADGSTSRTAFSGRAYPDANSPGRITFDVHHTIVGGTGRFAGASGSFDGADGRFNVVTPEELGGYEGTISSPGANKK